MSNISPESITNLRSKFLEEADSNPDLYHSVDIERVKTEEWQLRRFLMEHSGDVEKSVEHLRRSLKWKKEFGVHDLQETSFPREFYEVNGVEINGRTHDGALIQWEIFRNQYSFKELSLFYKKFVAFQLEKLDRLAGESGFVCITDASGSGVSNVDMDLSRFKIDAIDNYPSALKGIFMVELPWLMGSVMKLVVAMMSPQLKQLVKYFKAADLCAEIPSEHIPVSLKGTRDKCAFPSETKSICEIYSSLDLDEKFVDKYFKTLKIVRPN